LLDRSAIRSPESLWLTGLPSCLGADKPELLCCHSDKGAESDYLCLVRYRNQKAVTEIYRRRVPARCYTEEKLQGMSRRQIAFAMLIAVLAFVACTRQPAPPKSSTSEAGDTTVDESLVFKGLVYRLAEAELWVAVELAQQGRQDASRAHIERSYLIASKARARLLAEAHAAEAEITPLGGPATLEATAPASPTPTPPVDEPITALVRVTDDLRSRLASPDDTAALTQARISLREAIVNLELATHKDVAGSPRYQASVLAGLVDSIALSFNDFSQKARNSEEAARAFETAFGRLAVARQIYYGPVNIFLGNEDEDAAQRASDAFTALGTVLPVADPASADAGRAGEVQGLADTIVEALKSGAGALPPDVNTIRALDFA
jgi:hypothetical protein